MIESVPFDPDKLSDVRGRCVEWNESRPVSMAEPNATAMMSVELVKETEWCLGVVKRWRKAPGGPKVAESDAARLLALEEWCDKFRREHRGAVEKGRFVRMRASVFDDLDWLSSLVEGIAAEKMKLKAEAEELAAL